MSDVDQVCAVLQWLEPIAKPVADEAEPARWIAARYADPDQGPDWCTACAVEEVERLNALNPEHEYFVDGGWDVQTDVPPICEKCGKSLTSDFTKHAIEYETEHWLRHRVTLRGARAAEQAFRFTQVLESGDFDPANKDHAALLRKLSGMWRRRAAAGADGGKQ